MTPAAATTRPTETCPLYVDLDGTLTPSDTLYESVMLFIRRNPLNLLRLFVWLLLGKAGFKLKLANAVRPDPARLPYHERFVQYLREERARMRRPALAARLARVVLWDIVLSNIEVARRILGRESKMRPGFVWIPLDISNRHGISTLAGIITMTPGTVSSELSPDQRHLLVHFLHLEDADAAIAHIKSRYETPLREVFP